MKKLTKKQWNERHVFNGHNLAQAGLGLYIAFFPQVTGRMYRSAKWQIVKVGEKTDANASWEDCGNKSFHVHFDQSKDAQLDAAKKWAFDTFGVSEWERDPWGNWHPKGSMEAAAKNEFYCQHCGARSHNIDTCPLKKAESQKK